LFIGIDSDENIWANQSLMDRITTAHQEQKRTRSKNDQEFIGEHIVANFVYKTKS